MRKVFFILFALVSLFSYADRRAIVLNPKGHDKDRSGLPMYFDLPEAYYDESPKGQRIIIIGDGAVSYYDVEITSVATSTVEITTTVDGAYDSFDISSLSVGSHVITIDSPSGNTFEGTFTTY